MLCTRCLTQSTGHRVLIKISWSFQHLKLIILFLARGNLPACMQCIWKAASCPFNAWVFSIVHPLAVHCIRRTPCSAQQQILIVQQSPMKCGDIPAFGLKGPLFLFAAITFSYQATHLDKHSYTLSSDRPTSGRLPGSSRCLCAVLPVTHQCVMPKAHVCINQFVTSWC